MCLQQPAFHQGRASTPVDYRMYNSENSLGQHISVHGLSQTDGLAKPTHDPAMRWLPPSWLPTAGDWMKARHSSQLNKLFDQAAGYDSSYIGKWHVSHEVLVAPWL